MTVSRRSLALAGLCALLGGCGVHHRPGHGRGAAQAVHAADASSRAAIAEEVEGHMVSSGASACSYYD